MKSVLFSKYFSYFLFLCSISHVVKAAAPVFSAPSSGTASFSIAEDVATGVSIYRLSATDSDGDALTFSVTGSGVSSFQMDGNDLKTLSTFDYESTTSYTVTVVCSDGTGNTITATLTITVTDVNEFIPVFNPSVISTTIAENSAAGTAVASLTCSDSDGSTSSCTLSIQSGDDASKKFTISGTDIQTTSTAIDYEALSGQSYVYSLVVIGVDNGSPASTGTAKVFVTVTNVNEDTPTISGTTPSSITIAESVGAGTSVCTVAASDSDDGVYGTITFSLAGGNTGSAFTIDATYGVIYTVTSLDYETLTSYDLVVMVSDGDSPALSSTATVTVSISDVNDNTPTCSPDVYTIDVAETSTSGYNIVTLTCTDADSSGTIGFAIASGNTGGEFSLTAAGALSLSSALDYDGGTTTYTLLVNVDDGTTTSTTTVNINVVAANDNTPAFSSDPSVNVNENEAIGTSLTTYTATDNDASPHDIVKYEITSVTNTGISKFSIDLSSGVISLAQSLDYETTTEYEITVVATDGGGSTATGTVTIAVQDTNDNSPTCTSYTHATTVDENAAANTAVIANFGCSDSDAGTSLTYTLSLTPSDGSFSISGTSLIVAGTLDYEIQASYSGTVTVSDGTYSSTITFDITIGNINENTPSITATSPSSISIAENIAIATSVCSMVASDTDSGSFGTLSYSITGGNSGSEFTIDSGSGIIYTAKALDYETTTSYSLTVTVEDGGSLSSTYSVTIAVTDVNDNVPECSPVAYSSDVTEPSSTGTTVTTLTCSDGDAGTSLSYSINSGNSASVFTLGSSTGILTLASAVDFDAGTTSYTLVIYVTDSSSTATATVNVNIVAANESPPSFSSNPTVTLPESTNIGSAVTTYAATDTDASPHDITSYGINSVTNSGTSYFTIDSNTAVITLAKSLDYETTQSYEIEVVATDGGGSQGTGTVTVSVSAVNDNTPTCTSYAYAASVDEDAATSTSVISNFGCSDLDSGTSLTYTLSITPSDGKFTITGTALTVAAGLDYETQASYTGTITVSDGTNSVTISFDIAVGNINEHTPSISGTNPSSISLSENTAVATSVATVLATDSDDGTYGTSGLTFSITGGNTGSEFTIDSGSGVIYTAKALDYETTTSYTLVVKASDGGSPALTVTANVAVAITDENDNAPVCTPTVYNADVTETTSSGATVKSLTCSDGDSNTLTYAINSGNSAGKFALSSTTGVITLNSAIDYDSGTTSYILIMYVNDGTYTATATLNVNVVAANEDTPAFSSNPTQTIAEDSSIGTVVTTYAATDSDAAPHAIVSYSLQSATNSGTSYFTIDSDSAVIQVAQELDFETTQVYELTIVATDGGSLAGTGTVTVSVTDVNDNTPTCTTLAYALTVAENTATSTVVTTLTCSDGDGNSLSYSMSQNPDNKFAVSSSGQLSVSGSLDYETTTYYQLQVTVTDNGTPSKSTAVDIDATITNVNEGAPVFTGTYAVTLPEDSAIGSTIISVTATDVDNDAITFTFQTSYTNFILDSTSGAILLAQTLDYDTTPSHSLVVVASDGTATTTTTVTVTVDDVNESPVFGSSSYTSTLAENASSGTSVLTVAATDPDSALLGTITYSITAGNGGSHFTIDSSTGVISTSAVIDYETNTAFTIIVEAADGGTPSLSTSALVEITITDLNDNAPVFTASAYTVNVGEDSAVGTSLTTVTATDSDSATNNNNVFEYTTTSSVPFTVGTTSGEITVNAALDRETTASYTMEILATDKGSPAQTGTLTLTITLDDVNDNDPVISGTYDTTITEYTTVNTIVFTITASDADEGVNANLQYSFLSGNTNSDFSIEQNSGIIQTVNSLDRETTASYNLVVQVIDQGASPRSATVTATVTISDENDNTPTFTQMFSFSVDENVGTGTSVGDLTATDADTGSNAALSYSIVGYWVGGSNPFTVDISTGVITTTSSLDRESVDTYVIWCRVADSGSPSLSSEQNVTITINDVNDNDPIFNATTYDANVLENSAIGTQILTVVATDLDAGVNANISYAIDTSTTAGTRAELYLILDAYYGSISVEQTIDRESDTSFVFEVIASDAGSPVRSATTTVTITVQDENDNNPIFTTTFYNTEVPYNDGCGNAIATVTATDADSGVNADISYSLSTVTDSTLFQIDSSTGEVRVAATLDTKEYTMYAQATDGGSPQRTSGTSATIRIDGFSATGIVISFYMSINKTAYLAAESTFLSQLTTVYATTYSTCSVKRWCIIDQTDSIIVNVYVIQDNVTDSVSNIGTSKNFLHGSTSQPVVAINDAGTPATTITGAAWDYYAITKAVRYTESSSTTEDTPWIETTVGIATVTIACVGAVIIAVIATVVIVDYCRKSKTLPIENDTTPIQKNNVPRSEITEPYDSKKVAPKQYERPPSYTSSRYPNYNNGEPDIENVPLPVFAKSPKVTKGYIDASPPSAESGGSYNIKNRRFDGRAVDPGTGQVYEYNTHSNERNWLHTPEGDPVVVSNA